MAGLRGRDIGSRSKTMTGLDVSPGEDVALVQAFSIPLHQSPRCRRRSVPLAGPVPTQELTTACFPYSGLGKTADGMDDVFKAWSDRIPRPHHFTTPSPTPPSLHHSVEQRPKDSGGPTRRQSAGASWVMCCGCYTARVKVWYSRRASSSRGCIVRQHWPGQCHPDLS